MTINEQNRELRRWQKAVEDSQRTIAWLEQRGDQKASRIRALEAQVRSLGGTP